jgi:hypothetical protein
MAEDAFRGAIGADAFCRSAGAAPPSQRRVHPTGPYSPQRLPGFADGRIDRVIVGEIIGWRWWKVIDGGLFTFNGFKPIPKGPFEVDFPQRGGMAAFQRRGAAERMFAALTAKWPSYPKAVTFQSELPAGAPRVAPDAYCLGSIELWGTVHNTSAAISDSSSASRR